MHFLARYSLSNRALIALATIFATLGGVWAVNALDQELMPDLELPIVGVVTVLPGASPDLIDEQVSKPVAQAAMSVDGLLSTQATSNANVSSVMLELEYGTSAATAQQELQVAISRLSLPEDAQTQVISGSMADLPVLQLAVTSDADIDEVATLMRERVIPEIERVDGVQAAALSGARSWSIEIAADQAALAAEGLTVQSISEAFDGYGTVIPAGSVDDSGRTLSVQVGELLTSVEDVANLPIATETGSVTLSQVAEVSEVADAASSFSRTNGDESLGLAITRASGGNVVAISEAVQEMLPELAATIGGNAEIAVVFDQAPFIKDSIKDLTTEGLLGLAFAVAIILAFLRKWRATAVTAISIPLSLVIALIGIKTVGFSLNMFTLAALTISIGRVVDDSIVVIENIERHLSYGTPRREAILTAVKEVGGAIASATVATAAVFVPMGLVSGMVGELFRPFAFTVAVALLASLLVAITIVPVLAWWFLPAPPVMEQAAADAKRKEVEAAERKTFLARHYVRALRAAIGRPAITIIAAVAILGGTLASAQFVKTDFLGDTGENTVSLTQALPAGTSFTELDAAAANLEEIIAQVPEVEVSQVSGGAGDAAMAFLGMGGDTTFNLTLNADADPSAVQDQIRELIAEQDDAGDELGDVSIGAGMMGAFGSGLEVLVTAPDAQQLQAAATEVEQIVRDLPGTSDVQNNLAADLPTVIVSVDRDAAAQLGMTETQIGGLVAVAFNGIPAGEVTDGATVTNVAIRMSEAPASIEELENLPLVMGPQGPLLLGDVAHVEEILVPNAISRVNGITAATVTATTSAEDLGAQSAQLEEALAALDLPEGTHADIAGVSAEMEDAFGSLGLALILAIALVYLVMVATFKSLLQPFILLISIPFAATGAILALLITGQPLGVAGMIGALMLVGVVVTNAIVLIDLINQYRREGMALEEAIEEGARHRLRPILMTSLATIGALFPMALGITGGSAFISQPLALVVIGGLVTSTLLTLLLVPVFYRIAEMRGERRALAQHDSQTDKQTENADAEVSDSAPTEG